MFHRRKNSTSTTAEVDAVSTSLHQQTMENQNLRSQIEKFRVLNGNIKEEIEFCFKNNEKLEKKIQELKEENRKALEKIGEQDVVLKELRENKLQLVTDKDMENAVGGVKELQDLLELVRHTDEMLIFKDMYGRVWEISERN